MTDDFFFEKNGFSRETALRHLKRAAAGCDDAELFLQKTHSENCLFDDGRVKNASADDEQGFGLRLVAGDSFAYAHASDFTETALKTAVENVLPVKRAAADTAVILPVPSVKRATLYPASVNDTFDFKEKTDLLARVDAYVRAKDPRTACVTVSLSGSESSVLILRPDGTFAADDRPLAHFSVRVVLNENGRRETGSFGFGGRYGLDRIFKEENWRRAANEALRQAAVNLNAVPPPAGEMPVVLGNGWCGVLLHEAVGHGLEGDFARKETSVYAGKIGQRVAAKGVTVIDDGPVPERRGSLNIDDEGTPTQRNVLIEDGILTRYMQDRMNARLMRTVSTGNARRESFACPPQVRMTNTFMENGDVPVDEMIRSVKKGVYAVSFSGGQVDITSGSFVFGASEAYLIENGKIGAPVKNAMLIGSGTQVMNAVDMIGNDGCLDNGVGMCGKGGQSVPVGVGQPSLRLSKITVGGSNVG